MNINLLNHIQVAQNIMLDKITYEIFLSSINDDDKIWIYQADRKLSDDEAQQIQEKADQFAKQWTAHNNQLEAKAMVLFHLFVVMVVNENQHQASGCSIDSSVAFIKKLNMDFNIDLLQRHLVATLENDEIKLIHLNNLSETISVSNSIVFNNLVTTGKEFKNAWLTPIENSWHKRFLASNTH